MHNLKLWNASNKKNNLSRFTDEIKNNLKFNTYLDLPSIPACLNLHNIDVIVRVRSLKDNKKS